MSRIASTNTRPSSSLLSQFGAQLWLIQRAALPPTFAKDIAPILFERCVSCHRPEASAPFSLLTYADVRPRARQRLENGERGVDVRVAAHQERDEGGAAFGGALGETGVDACHGAGG